MTTKKQKSQNFLPSWLLMMTQPCEKVLVLSPPLTQSTFKDIQKSCSQSRVLQRVAKNVATNLILTSRTNHSTDDSLMASLMFLQSCQKEGGLKSTVTPLNHKGGPMVYGMMLNLMEQAAIQATNGKELAVSEYAVEITTAVLRKTILFRSRVSTN